MSEKRQIDIRVNKEENRFEAELDDGDMAIIDYIDAGNNLVYTHTEVPEKYEGQGIGSQMARFALDYARENGRKVQAQCPFIAAYVRRHEEYQDITWGYEK